MPWKLVFAFLHPQRGCPSKHAHVLESRRTLCGLWVQDEVWWSNVSLRVEGVGERHLSCPSPGPIPEAPITTSAIPRAGENAQLWLPPVPMAPCPWPQLSWEHRVPGLDMAGSPNLGLSPRQGSGGEPPGQRRWVPWGREGGFGDLACKSFEFQFYQLIRE